MSHVNSANMLPNLKPRWNSWLGKRADLHNHTIYSDGKSEPEAVILSAIEKGLEIIGISDHAPVGFKEAKWAMKSNNISNYIAEINQLKIKYQAKIQVLLGIEVDYYQGCAEHIGQLNLSKFDYTIGSVHFFSLRKPSGDFYGIDSSPLEFAEAIKNCGGAQTVCENFYSLVIEAAQSGWFTFLGHFDLIKKYNFESMHFNEQDAWYQQLSLKTLHEVAKTGIPIEINTSAKRKGHTSFYPSEYLIKEAIKLGIPMFTNSDSHHYGEVGFGQD